MGIGCHKHYKCSHYSPQYHPYQKSSEVYGKETWISTLHGIWYTQISNYLIIGNLMDIGESSGVIASEYGNQCPFNLPSEKWKYRDGNGWKSAGAKEINVFCLKGNFSKY